MFDTFSEPHFFTFSVIFSHIASIFTFSVEFFSHLATFSHIAAFSHLRVPQMVFTRNSYVHSYPTRIAHDPHFVARKNHFFSNSLCTKHP